MRKIFREPTGMSFDAWQVNNFVSRLNQQQSSKALSEGEFFTSLIRLFTDGVSTNPFYKKTPKVFSSLTVFYVQLAKAFRIVYPKLQLTHWDLCMYLYRQTNLLQETYSLRGGSIPDVAASEASRILKDIYPEIKVDKVAV